jgi:hypothetical protein
MKITIPKDEVKEFALKSIRGRYVVLLNEETFDIKYEWDGSITMETSTKEAEIKTVEA